MSLDVYLYKEESNPIEKIILEDEFGRTQEFYAEEWHYELPMMTNKIILFEANITHNLNTMADAAGIYKHLWRPGEVGIVAATLIQPLTKGLALLESDPDYFKVFNPKNGWGSYEDFVPWVKKYLAACKKYPDAFVEADR